MRIAFFTYPSAFQNIGGGEILLLKLKEYLEKEGIHVDLFDTWHSRISEYDFLHVFGSVKDCLGLIRVAKDRNVKVAITPLIWSDWRRAIFSDSSVADKVDFLSRHLTKVVCPSFPSGRRQMLLSADLIFPNSEIEKRHIARLFAIPRDKMRVVYNGVDPVFLKAKPDIFWKQVGKFPFILGVGRIEPRKNQLNLIKAVNKTGGRKLVLIGSPVSGYEDYFHRCQKEGQGFVTFIPTIPHSEPLLASAYAACDLFVLQGWFETPGLVAMEAALAGSRVVATKGGSTKEYFRDLVEYLDPSSPNDIYRKITSALNRSKSEALKKHVAEHFGWSRIAKSTIEFYQEFGGK